MYLQEIPADVKVTTMIQIKYDCCGIKHILKHKDAKKNFEKNGGKHICRQCWLRTNNPAKNKDVQDKIRKTCEEKYGGMPMNSKEQIQKRKEKFQDENYKKQWAEKHRSTSLEKYGVEHPMHLESTKIKQKQTMQEKYGVDHPYQSPEIMKKMKQKNLEKYGVENVAQLPEVQIKMAQTTLEKYGVEHYNELPEMREYLRQNCPQWLSESWANGGPMKGIIRPEEWNQKARETITKLMMAGKWKSGYPMSKKGFCYPDKKCKKDKVYFRSSYEAIYCYYLDNNDLVEWFSFESFRIPYDFKGKTRFYVPDFLVKWKNTDVLSIKEIKAEFLKEDEKQIAKQVAANLFANINCMDYELLFNEQIKSINITFDFLKEIKFVR